MYLFAHFLLIAINHRGRGRGAGGRGYGGRGRGGRGSGGRGGGITSAKKNGAIAAFSGNKITFD